MAASAAIPSKPQGSMPAAKPAPGSWVIVIDSMGDLSSHANVGSAKVASTGSDPIGRSVAERNDTTRIVDRPFS